MDIKSKLKNRRLELGLTIEEVAREVGVSGATVSRWETGDIENMRRDKIALLAKALQVSPSFIMGWTDETTNSIDDDILVISRAAKKMSPERRKEMLDILKIAFKEEFK